MRNERSPKQRKCRACGQTISVKHAPWIAVSLDGFESSWHDWCKGDRRG